MHHSSATFWLPVRADEYSSVVKNLGPSSVTRPYSTHSHPWKKDAVASRRSPSVPVGRT